MSDKTELNQDSFLSCHYKTNPNSEKDSTENLLINISQNHENKNVKLITILKNFIKKFTTFFGIRALLSLISIISKLKFRIHKISLNDLLNLSFNNNNLRFGFFMSVMPFIYSILTELIFELKKKNNNFSSKLIVFLSGFLSALIVISFSEQSTGLMDYIILSLLVRSILAYIKAHFFEFIKGLPKKSFELFVFFASCVGYLFIAKFHGGFQKINKSFLKFCCFINDNERNEITGVIRDLNIFKSL